MYLLIYITIRIYIYIYIYIYRHFSSSNLPFRMGNLPANQPTGEFCRGAGAARRSAGPIWCPLLQENSAAYGA